MQEMCLLLIPETKCIAKMKKRIAIIIPGGIGVGPLNQGIPILEALLKRLSKNNDIVVFPLGRVNEGYTPRGFRVEAIRDNYDQSLLKRIIKTIFLLRKIHRKEKFDRLHGIWTFPAGFMAILLGKFWGVQSVVSLQGGGLARLKNIKYGGRVPLISNWCIRWTLKNARHITAESCFQRDLISDADIRKRVKIIPYGVDTHLFSFRPKSPEVPLRFIHIANLNPVKDQETLVRTFHLIRQQTNAHLTIVGPDYMNGKIQNLVSRLGLNEDVLFTGFVAHQKIPCYLHEAQIMLHTSLHEGMPLVVVEAMASGVVVCGTKVGIIADLSPQCCISVPIGDYVGLAKEVIQLVHNEEQYHKIQKRARNWAQHHTIDWTCRQFEKMYA